MSRKEEGVLRIHQLNGKIEYPNVADFRKTEGFRLPTEVEWEWFARGGEIAMQDGTFNYDYSGSNNLDEVAWYSGADSLNEWKNYMVEENILKTRNVGRKKSNQLDLYDCSGNVWEWCYDTYSDGYISEETPYIYDKNETNRRLKGGSWVDRKEHCKISYRYRSKTTNSSSNYGFRIVRTI